MDLESLNKLCWKRIFLLDFSLFQALNRNMISKGNIFQIYIVDFKAN